jgi:hypothetical protein
MDRTDAIFIGSLVERLSKRQPPWMKKDDVADEMDLQVGTWYRLPWFSDDHLLHPGRDHAICGRTLTAEIHDTIYEALATTGVVVRGLVFLSSRKGNKCSECASTWKKGAEKMVAEAAIDAAEVEDHEMYKDSQRAMRMLNPSRRVEEHRMMSMVWLVQRELGGELV